MAICQRRVGVFQGVYVADGVKRLRVHPIDCGSWACPVCGIRKAKRTYARAMAGKIAKNHEKQNSHKLLTLTVPGQEYRNQKTIREAYNEGSAAITGLMKYLKYHLGEFGYLRVCELQKDGFPHWHVILVGDAIAPKYVLRMIEDYWRGVCGLGFVKLNRISGDEGLKRALRYVLKYLFKAAGEDWGEQMKGTRRYQGSREIMGPVEGKPGRVWVHEKVQLGNIGRFVGVEFGRFCVGAEGELVDMPMDGEIGKQCSDVLGPLLRMIADKG